MIRSSLEAAEDCPDQTLREEVGALFVELEKALTGDSQAVPPAETE
jgi:hypothetical protein